MSCLDKTDRRMRDIYHLPPGRKKNAFDSRNGLNASHLIFTNGQTKQGLQQKRHVLEEQLAIGLSRGHLAGDDKPHLVS